MSDPCTCSWGAPHGDPCRDKRLAKGTDGIERAWTDHERFLLYARGFRDGAGARSMGREESGLGAYERGYTEGLAARRAAVDAFAKEIGYVPTILRTAVDPDRSADSK